MKQKRRKLFLENEIKEIALNPSYVTSDYFKMLEMQGFNVCWMTKNESKEDTILTLVVEE